MTDFNLLDSSVWVAYFFEGHHKQLIESDETFFLSILSLFEIKKKLLERKINSKEIEEKLTFMKVKSILIEPNELIAEFAAGISLSKKIPALDSLIYSTSIKSNATLLTQDNDFRNLEKVQVLNIE